MHEDALDVFYIHVETVLSWWDRIKVLLGKRPVVNITLPVYEDKETGGLTSEAESSVAVAPLFNWPRHRGGGYEVRVEEQSDGS